MNDFNDFERAVIEKLLTGENPIFTILREQARIAYPRSREYTGAGFFLYFSVPANAPFLAVKDFFFGDVNAMIDGLQYGAGFVLFIRKGCLDVLEGYSYDEPWPKEIHKFKLTYQCDPRELKLSEISI